MRAKSASTIQTSKTETEEIPTDTMNTYRARNAVDDEYRASIEAEADAQQKKDDEAELEVLENIYPGLKPVKNKDGMIEMTIIGLNPDVQRALEIKLYGDPSPEGRPAFNESEIDVSMKTKRETIREMLDNAEKDEVETHRVTLLRDHSEDYPELWMSVFVQDPTGRDEKYFVDMLTRSRCYKAKTVDEADFVVFTGGADIHPMLYRPEDAKNHPSVRPDTSRDVEDVKVFLHCLEEGIPMFGVCRGLQLLHILNGGDIFQDVNGHHESHSLWDINAKAHIQNASSVHHQMVRYDGKIGELLATGGKSSARHKDAESVDYGKYADPEAMFYRDTCCLGVQGHPEYSGYPEFTKWCVELMNEFYAYNPDLIWKDKTKRRLKDEIIEKRSFEIRPEVKAFLDKFDNK